MLDMNVINRPSMNTLAVGEETGLLALAQDLVPRWSCSGLASCGCCLEGDRFKSLALDLSAEAGGLISMGALHNANTVSSVRVSSVTRRVPVIRYGMCHRTFQLTVLRPHHPSSFCVAGKSSSLNLRTILPTC